MAPLSPLLGRLTALPVTGGIMPLVGEVVEGVSRDLGITSATLRVMSPGVRATADEASIQGDDHHANLTRATPPYGSRLANFLRTRPVTIGRDAPGPAVRVPNLPPVKEARAAV